VTAHILMLAAENDALPILNIEGREVSGKIGGIGDVVRDAPRALAGRGCEVTVVSPAYGVFADAPGCKRLTGLNVAFGGRTEGVEIYEIPARNDCPGVRHLVLEHTLFSICGRGRIYCDDPPQTPFARDASKFALFCASAVAAVEKGIFGDLNAVHLHDWHTALVLVLRRFDPAYRLLRKLRCVYTIHNLALQGIRPFEEDDSSLQSWFPALRYDRTVLQDPRWPNCLNATAAAIRLADAVHTVSPSYAKEIMRPSAVAAHGYHGGEGLESDLQAAHDQGRLFGILNGCDYGSNAGTVKEKWSEITAQMRAQVLRWAAVDEHLATAHFLAHLHLAVVGDRRPGIVLTGVGRITEQKIGLLRQTCGDDRPALESVLERLGERGVLILLGTGDPSYEMFLTATSARYDNLVFLRGYSDDLARALYIHGDLFLMPSSFEPCGVSQMLSMREGQPCLVHDVGGLRDTVKDKITGFSFGGDGLTKQADNLVAALDRAFRLYFEKPAKWRTMRGAAAASRFKWGDSVEGYMKHLYRLG